MYNMHRMYNMDKKPSAFGIFFKGFVFRIFFANLLTSLVVAVVLLSLDKLPLVSEPIIALKRIILVAMPASMGAIVVDSFDKE